MDAGLRRRIGLGAAIALVVGNTIGVGIFLTPAGMARDLASPALLFTVWAFMGAAAICGALSFGELASRFPQAGGAYVYLREAFGPATAFLYGWKCLLVMDPGLTAALATGLGAYAQVLAPAADAPTVAVASIALVAGANLLGVRLAAAAGQVLNGTKVGLLIVLVGWGFLSGAGSTDHFTPWLSRRSPAPPLAAALAGALVQAFFSFGGWWETSKLTGEVRDPERTVPRALMTGVAIVTILYVSVSAVFLYLVPLDRVTSPETFAAQAGSALFGEAGGRVLAGIVVLSVAGSLFAFMTSAPRVYYAMARDGAMPSATGRLAAGTGAPVAAILLQAALASVLVLVGTFEAIVAYFIFVTVCFLGLTVAGLYVLRRRDGRTSAGPAFAAAPALFLASITLILALLLAGRPRESLLGVGVAALGVPVYRLFFRRQSA